MKDTIKDNFEIVISRVENSFYNEKYRLIKINKKFLYLKVSKDLTISDLNKNYIIIIYGYIEGFNTKRIFDIVNKSEIDDYIKIFNGKFVLFIIDKINGNSKVYSDRLNSKNIFLFINNDNFIYSNNIYNFKRFNLTINKGALGFYLSNGYLIGESTLFNEIETFSYALKHIIDENKIKRKKY